MVALPIIDDRHWYETIRMADGVTLIVCCPPLKLELLSQAMRGQVGGDYHRLLLALDAPLDVY